MTREDVKIGEIYITLDNYVVLVLKEHFVFGYHMGHLVYNFNKSFYHHTGTLHIDRVYKKIC